MGGSFSSGSQTINGTVTVIGSTTDSKLLTLTGTQAGAGTTTLGTVPAGKTWRIYSATLNTSEIAAATGYGFLKFDGVNHLTTVNVSNVVGASYGVAVSSPSNNLHIPSGKYIEVAATKAITLVVSGGGTTVGAVVGYQEV